MKTTKKTLKATASNSKVQPKREAGPGLDTLGIEGLCKYIEEKLKQIRADLTALESHGYKRNCMLRLTAVAEDVFDVTRCMLLDIEDGLGEQELSDVLFKRTGITVQILGAKMRGHEKK